MRRCFSAFSRAITSFLKRDRYLHCKRAWRQGDLEQGKEKRSTTQADENFPHSIKKKGRYVHLLSKHVPYVNQHIKLSGFTVAAKEHLPLGTLMGKMWDVGHYLRVIHN
eukprot:1143517-Pelagomonas_calceolata.AAC.5